MLNSKSLGNKIAEARKKLNISQADLAQQLSISAQAVGKWERGESLPDIITLDHLAQIFGVDLNHFSDRSSPAVNDESAKATALSDASEIHGEKQHKNTGWNMSEGNWEGVDFSGLKNLQEKFSASNLKHCKFVGSELSGLVLRNNNFNGCDFSDADISNSTFQKSNLANNSFKNCLLKNTGFSDSYIYECDLTAADLTEVVINGGGFEKNTIHNTLWRRTAFTGTKIVNVVFEGNMEDCSFDKCSFSKVTFQHVKFTNTFIKYSDLKRVKFIDCQADRITYELLKFGKADLTGITLILSE